MPTGKIGTRSSEEFMSDYQPIYQPIYPLLMKNAVQYNEEVGEVNFRRASTVGDVRAKHITPKDTEMRLVAVAEGKKKFAKYFMGNKYQVSHLQNQEDTETVIAEVLDENHKLADELLMMGEGTSNGSVVNNGIYFSQDPNFVENDSVQVAATGLLLDFHNKVVTAVQPAKKIAGEKLIVFYGAGVLSHLNGLHPETTTPFRKALEDALGAGFTIVEAPENAYPSGAEGFLIVNLDRIKVHYMKLPEVDDAGSNDEMKYNWVNFLQGSMMVDVLTKGAIIKQPLTFQVI